jgi:hypothetical protein
MAMTDYDSGVSLHEVPKPEPALRGFFEWS